MPKEGSVAPKERINIKYVPATGDAQAEMELPLKTVVIGDFNGRLDDTPLEDRQAVSVDKNNFSSVMKESNISVTTAVANKLNDSGEEQDLSVNLSFSSLSDFSPDSIVQQVPELKKLIELREALVALKGPLGNISAFRTRIQDLISDPENRDKLLSELQLVSESKDEK